MISGATLVTSAQSAPPAAPAARQTAAPAPAQGTRGRVPDPNAGADFSSKAPVRILTPEEEAKTFILPAGYRMELVASDPDLVNPVTLEFDGNGRMYVAEMRTYMLDVEGSNEHDPVSRISRWESTKGDGKYDKHTVFADNLILPRAILPLKDGIATNETDSNDLIELIDTNGDGVADKRTVLYTGVGEGRDGNLEHEQSGFLWGLDNWIYSTYNAFRIRWTPNGTFLKEPTAPNSGQWGLAQDDSGKMWWVDAGGERGPMNFQFPNLYGSYNPPGMFEDGFETVWPAAIGYGDMQGGMARVRTPLGVLNHFTATCGPEIVRGDRLPADLRGDLLFAEPVGRLIRRARIVDNAGLTQLQNVYPGSEFILSTDPNFRPVNIKNAPDGSIYILDMYHGIIQESQWTPAGSYLRAKIQQWQLDKVIGKGRIWRLVHDDMPLDRTQPRMLDETPAQLVAHLRHPNGWWRDTAQRLLVLRQDTSVVPALQQMARADSSLLARFHAMWTLEGLGALDAPLTRDLLKDSAWQMRVQALRASESLYKAGDQTFAQDYATLSRDPDSHVVVQAMLTANLFKLPDATSLITSAQSAAKAKGVQDIAARLLNPPAAFGGFGGRGRGMLTTEQQALVQRGQGVYTELCFSCHGDDGKGAPLAGAPAGTTMAPPLAGSARVQGHPDYVIKVLLNGLAGPIDGNTYSAGIMVPMGTQSDEWIASAASFVRSSFGNTGTPVSAADVARVRKASARSGTWTLEELEASLPVLVTPAATWKASASENGDAASGALDGSRAWTTEAPQREGTWYQVELPDAVTLSEVQFDAAMPAFGRGGRGGPPPAAPGASPAGAARAGAPPAASGTTAPGAATAARPAASGAAPGGGTSPAAAAAGAPGTPGRGAQPAQGRQGGGGFGRGFGVTAAQYGYPRGYKVEVSTDGTTWTPVATGVGDAPTTTAAFTPVRAKFVRVTATAADATAPAWSVQRLRLYQPAAPAKASQH